MSDSSDRFQAMDFDKEEARRWLQEGDVAKALRHMNECADAGSIDALVALADHYLDAGESALSEQCIERAERSLQADDWDGHVSLSSAYLIGLGAGDPVSRQKRSLAHLEQVGEAGNLFVQESLMLHYLEGLNGAPCDPVKARYWAEMAAKNGSARSLREWKEN